MAANNIRVNIATYFLEKQDVFNSKQKMAPHDILKTISNNI